MRNAAATRLFGALAAVLMMPFAAAPQPVTAPPDPIAQIGDRAITLEELDVAGGRAVYDLVEQLYEARVRTLYQLLSSELMEREAKVRGVTPDQLSRQEVAPKIAPVTDRDVEQFLKAQGSAAGDESTRKQARMYLGMKHQADAKRTFITTLFQKYNVRIGLAAPPPPPAEQILGPMDASLGKADTPVPIVVFSDYLCPYCRELSHTLDSLLKAHPDQVHIIYRHFPLHENSKQLAHAALCAGDQHKFAEFHHALFARSATERDESAIAAAIQLDLPGFKACMADQRYEARIQADVEEGKRLRINGTPTVFVAGQRLRGAQSLQRLSDSVQAALDAKAQTTLPTARL